MENQEFSRHGVHRGPMRAKLAFVLMTGLCAGLITSAAVKPGNAGNLPLPDLITIPAGPALIGSQPAEREAAYVLDERAYGHSVTRKQGWYNSEKPLTRIELPGFQISKTVITNRQYAAFIKATGHRAPDVTAALWKTYRLIHPYGRTRRHAWPNSLPPKGRLDHPVVLVSHSDARAYAAWLSKQTKRRWRLPTETEWEKAARGTDGRRFPWGNEYDPKRLNSADNGPNDTQAVGLYPKSASPFGLLDAAGQVFEWTATAVGEKRFMVKGGGWDDEGCGVCRPAARHSRPAALKHILIGFRLVAE